MLASLAAFALRRPGFALAGVLATALIVGGLGNRVDDWWTDRKRAKLETKVERLEGELATANEAVAERDAQILRHAKEAAALADSRAQNTHLAATLEDLRNKPPVIRYVQDPDTGVDRPRADHDSLRDQRADRNAAAAARWTAVPTVTPSAGPTDAAP